MKRTISFLTAICMCLFVFAGCGSEDVEQNNTAAVNVTVHKVTKNDIDSEVSYTGEIKAFEESDIAPKISATIMVLNYDIGDYVEAGDVLAVLDDTDYRLSYNQALAAYNSAVSSLNQTTNQLKTAISSAQIEYNSALDNYNRQKALYDAGAISKVAFESAETRFKNAELNLNSAKSNYNTTVGNNQASAQAAVESAKATLDIASNSLNNTQIISPISGYVASRNGNVGQIAAAGSPLFSIKNSEMVNIEISVTESVIPYITTDTKAIINVETANIKHIEGIVSAVNTVKSQQTGMYTVRIKIDNKDEKLKIGMMADVILQTQSSNNALIIPNDAIMQEDEGYYVYVVNDNFAKKRVIKIGISNNDFTEVTSGIKENEIVVVSGKEFISEKNNSVNIVEE